MEKVEDWGFFDVPVGFLLLFSYTLVSLALLKSICLACKPNLSPSMETSGMLRF